MVGRIGISGPGAASSSNTLSNRSVMALRKLSYHTSSVAVVQKTHVTTAFSREKNACRPPGSETPHTRMGCSCVSIYKVEIWCDSTLSSSLLLCLSMSNKVFLPTAAIDQLQNSKLQLVRLIYCAVRKLSQ